jgi:hypothetical protein
MNIPSSHISEKNGVKKIVKNIARAQQGINYKEWKKLEENIQTCELMNQTEIMQLKDGQITIENR